MHLRDKSLHFVQLHQALGDKVRLKIVQDLAKKGTMCAGEIHQCFSISAPAISQHLKILVNCEIVICTKQAQKRYFKINPQQMNELADWVDDLRQNWHKQFNQLESYLTKPKPSK